MSYGWTAGNSPNANIGGVLGAAVGSTLYAAWIDENNFSEAAYSTNNGATWTPATVPQVDDVGVLSIVFAGSTGILAGNGIPTGYISTDSGNTWTLINPYIGASWTGISVEIAGVATDGAGNWLAVCANNPHTATSSDNGVTWTQHLNVGPGVSWVTTAPLWNGFEWVALAFDAAGNLYVATSPDGVTWANTAVPSTAGLFGGALAFNNSSYLLAVSANQVAIGGSPAAVAVATPITVDPSFAGIALGWDSTNDVWVAADQGSPNAASSPDGVVWTSGAPFPFAGDSILSMAVGTAGLFGFGINLGNVALGSYTVVIPNVAVPNVLGDTPTAATSIIEGATLTVGGLVNAYSSSVPPGLISGETPAAGTLVPPGSAVMLNVSLGPPLPSPGSSLTTTIPAYPYQQYADDDNIQALFAAYNQATQYYVTWFATVTLPYYPGLTGALLNWVAEGLYGLARYNALSSPAQPAIGPLNTTVLNDTTPANDPAGQLNYFAFPTETVYALTDDFFQRILTWDIYKADGKRFSIPWLKARIMRFLTWPNGAPPDPTVGPENTTAISVEYSGAGPYTCTVGINQALLSALVPTLAPGILPVFQAAFEGGVLDLPPQFTYVCNILTMLTAVVNPNTAISSGNASSQVTNKVTVELSGGSGSYLYAWTWQSGGAGITITSPSAASTTFSTTGLASGTKVTGVALVTVTDTITSHSTTATVAVGIENAQVLAVSVQPTVITESGASSSISGSVTATNVSGGIPPYSYGWAWQSGGAGIQIVSPNSAITEFTATGLAPGQTDTGVALLTVSDSASSHATATVNVSLSRANTPVVTLTATTLSITGASAAEQTGTTTASIVGGVGPYTYAWAWQSGGAGITINGAATATASFSTTALPANTTFSGTAVLTVTDSLGQKGQATCNVSIQRVATVTALASPATQSSSSIATTQATGSSTVTPSGGVGPFTYAWAWIATTGNLTINSPSSATTSFTGSNLTNGDTYTGTAQCTVTDSFGQTATATVAVTIDCIGTLTIYNNAAAAVFVIPNGVSLITLEGEAFGGPGAPGTGNVCEGSGGMGGGAGGYFRTQLAVTSADWGKTINVSATNNSIAATVISSGTFALPTMTANIGTSGSSGGTGGGASGGNQANIAGQSGSPGTGPVDGGLGGAGGSPTATLNGGSYGGGGHGGSEGNHPPQANGQPGGVVIKVA